MLLYFFFNDTATTEIYTLSLHDALPIYRNFIGVYCGIKGAGGQIGRCINIVKTAGLAASHRPPGHTEDRKSTRLNSSHSQISYAVFCLKKKNKYYVI